MKWLLGPGQHDLRVPLHHYEILAAAIDSPEHAWSYHQDLTPSERLWVLGDADFIAQFCEPPWQGLYHLVARVEHPIPQTVADASVALIGKPMPNDRLAEFCNALQWPDSQQSNGTQLSTCRGAVNWIDDLPKPQELNSLTEGVPVPVLARAGNRWPAAQFWTGDSPAGPMPLLLPGQWMSNRTALDALAQLREYRAQTL